MAAIPGGAYGFLAISIVAFVILGSVLEGIPAIVLFGPLLFPIAKQVGVHEVHYAMVVIFAMGIGLFAPPFGVGYYGACAISKIRSRRRPQAHLGLCRGPVHRPRHRRRRAVALDRLPQILKLHGNRCNEPLFWRDPAGRLCRPRHRGGHGLLEPRARHRAVVLQPAGADRELPLPRRSLSSRTIRWRWPIPVRCRWS